MLSGITVGALYGMGKNVGAGYNRKEKKDHGEGGVLVGADVADKSVWIIDDVITAGTAVREVIALLKAAGACVAGVIVLLDRKERGQSARSAIDELAYEYGIKVKALIDFDDITAYLAQKNAQDELAKMRAYRNEFGV